MKIWRKCGSIDKKYIHCIYIPSGNNHRINLQNVIYVTEREDEMDEKKTLYERIKQLDKQVRWLTKGDKQMKIDIVGEIRDNPDGSGDVVLDCDDEGRAYLMQLGFELLLRRGMDAMKHDKEQYERNR